MTVRFGYIVYMDSFDMNLFAAQMIDGQLPFEDVDDLSPELVRIALECGHGTVMNMNSMDGFVDRYPHYQFKDGMIRAIADYATPSRKFIEHVLRTTPDGAYVLFDSEKFILEVPSDVVGEIIEGNEDLSHLDGDSMMTCAWEKKDKYLTNVLCKFGESHVEKIMCDPNTTLEVKHIIEDDVLCMIEGDWHCNRPELMEFLARSPHSSVDFLTRVAEHGETRSIRAAAYSSLLMKNYIGGYGS